MYEQNPGRFDVDIIPFIIVGIVAGWIAGKIMRGGGYGLLGNFGLGLIGAYIGGNVLEWVGIEAPGGMAASIFTAVVGAVILLGVLGLFRSKAS